MKQPCEKLCPRRKAGCAKDCLEWAEYIKWRNQDYERRKALCKQAEAVSDGYRRCGAKNGMI